MRPFRKVGTSRGYIFSIILTPSPSPSFADDTAIFTSSNTTSTVRNRLQESINEFEKWCSSWKLIIQPSKTELLHLSSHPRKKYPNPVHLRVSNMNIRPQSSARYLGVIFDQRLHWGEHIKHVETRAQSRINLLRFFNRITPDSNDRIMLNLFKSLIRPVLTHGFSVCLKAEDKIWNILQIIQNKALRAALFLPHFTSATYIHKLTNIPYIRSYVTNFTKRALVRS
jgi:Reverse transcriptase (RNA-dependent DNA polymerase)